MKNFKPYRLVCGEYTPCVHDEQGRFGLDRTIYQNTTRLSGLELAPLNVNTYCGVTDRCTPVDGAFDYTTNPCGPWPFQPTNTYSASATTHSFSNCNHIGYVQACAVRTWHGAFGWTSVDNGSRNASSCITPITDGMGLEPTDPLWFPFYDIVRFDPFQAEPSSTKYLTLSSDVTIHVERYIQAGGGSGNTMDATGTGDIMVDAATGNITSTLSTHQTETQTTSTWGTVTTKQIDNGAGTIWNADGTVNEVITSGGGTAADAVVGSDVHVGGAPFLELGTWATNVQNIPDNFNQQVRNAYIVTSGAVRDQLLPEMTDLDNYSGIATRVYMVGSVEAQKYVISCSWSRTETTYTWDVSEEYTTRYTNDATPPPPYENDIASHTLISTRGTLTLSNPNTATDISDSLTALLEPWDLTNRVLMPLKTSSNNGIMVKVELNERASAITPVQGFREYGWTDPSNADYDGSVIGAPNGAGGDYPEDYFQSRIKNYTLCESSGLLEISSYGAWRRAYEGDGTQILPPRATNWTNLIEAYNESNGNFLPIGAFTFSGDKGGNRVWRGKWAESVIRLPSYNHARPYGSDRNSHDQTTRVCEDDVLTVGELRFPDCPPMGGRLAVLAVAPTGSNSLITTEDNPILIDGSESGGTAYTIQICKAGMTPISTNLTPTSIDNGRFTVPVSASLLTEAKWVVLQGALATDTPVAQVAKWYWADSEGKGNALLCNWSMDYRTNSEITRITPSPAACYEYTGSYNDGFKEQSIETICKGYVDCAPYMLVISPNMSDIPPIGKFFFMDTAYIDELYGSKDITTISQAMIDPLFQATPACGLAPVVDCIPYIEARNSLPYSGSISTTPPNNGAGMSQNETPPTPPIDYTFSTVGMPSHTSQPIHYYIPSGISTICPPQQ